jgi:hypothetical protein
MPCEFPVWEHCLLKKIKMGPLGSQEYFSQRQVGKDKQRKKKKTREIMQVLPQLGGAN